MRRSTSFTAVALLIAAASALFAAPLPAIAAPFGRPDPATIIDDYPKAALAAGVAGVATIRCVHDDRYRPIRCTLVSEAPEGQGFGAAALAIAGRAVANPYARPTPAEAATPESLTFHFQPGPKPTIYPNLLYPRDTPIRGYQWSAGPTSGQQAAAFPRAVIRLRMDGRALLSCYAAPDGALAECQLFDESPKDAGVGDAALALSRHMRLEPTFEGHTVAGARVFVPFRFPVPADPRFAAPPAPPRTPAQINAIEAVMAYYPPIARGQGVQGIAFLKCGRDAQMRPTGCKAAYERPFGYGFGEAALRLAALTPPNTEVSVEPMAAGADLSYKFCLRPPLIVPNGLLPRRLVQPAKIDRPPSEAEMAAVYPPEAFAAHQGGRVMVHCVVGVDGALNDCIVWNENPQGKGFAAAALALTGAYHATPLTIDNHLQAGAPLTLEVLFGGQSAPPPPPPAPMSIDTQCTGADPLG